MTYEAKCPACGHMNDISGESSSEHEPDSADAECYINCGECNEEITIYFRVDYWFEQTDESYAEQYFKLRGYDTIPNLAGWVLDQYQNGARECVSDNPKIVADYAPTWEFVLAHVDDPIIEELRTN